MSIRLSKAEQETTILYTLDPDEQDATISTTDPRMIHRLRRLGVAPERTEMDGNRIVSAEFCVPRSWLRIAPPRSASARQRESARLAMQALNERRAEARNKPRRRRPAQKKP